MVDNLDIPLLLASDFMSEEKVVVPHDQVRPVFEYRGVSIPFSCEHNDGNGSRGSRSNSPPSCRNRVASVFLHGNLWLLKTSLSVFFSAEFFMSGKRAVIFNDQDQHVFLSRHRSLTDTPTA